MKQKKQSGQALILTLILLAISTLFVVPALTLSHTSVRNSQIVTQRANDFYHADAAQEFVMWKLMYTNFINTFTEQDPLDSSKYYSPEGDFTVDVCGSPVDVTVVMRALATFRGVTLIGNTPIRPSKTVTPNTDPSGAVTYIIRLEQISDNTSQGLDAVYDVFPADFKTTDYIPGSSKLRVDGGTWQSIDDPFIDSKSGSGFATRLRWPASGSFALPIRDFTVGQVKEIEFQMASINLKSNMTYYNWVVLKPWDTLSGATATIVKGTGAGTQGGLMEILTTVFPSFVSPGETTLVRYTITIKNQQSSNDFIKVVTDYLPPGFSYVSGSTGGMTTIDPETTYEPVNGINRWKLYWDKDQFPGGNDISISNNPPNNQKTMTFYASTSENVSGSYYNELLVQTRNGSPNAFSDLGIDQQDFNTGYTWNSAAVVIPAYDSSTSSGDVITNANIAVTTGGASITSYQVR